jgi:hypothetical protein
MRSGFNVAYTIPVSFDGIYYVHYIVMVPVQPVDVFEKSTPCRLALTPPHAILHLSLFV